MFMPVTQVKPDLKSYYAKMPINFPVRSAKALVGKSSIKPFLTKIHKMANAPDEIYQSLYKQTLHNYVEFVQGLPAFKITAFNYHGGLLDLGITRTHNTLKLYRKQFPTDKIAPEKMPAKLALWSYALFTAALFYGTGYIASNYLVSMVDESGANSTPWDPFQGSMQKFSTHYQYSYDVEVNRDPLAARSASLLARQLIPEDGFAWLSSDREVFDFWLAILQDDERGGGMLAKFIMMAQNEIIAELQNLSTLPFEELPEEINEEDHEKNKDKEKKEEGKNDVKTEEETKQQAVNHLITGKSIGASLLSTDVTGGLTNVEIGAFFIEWLKTSVQGHGRQRGLSVNQSDSLIHRVGENALFVNAELLEKFVKENPQLKIKNAQSAQKQLLDSHLAKSSQPFGAKSSSMGSLISSFGKASSQQHGVVMPVTAVYNTAQAPAVSKEMTLPAQVEKSYPDVPEAKAQQTSAPASPSAKPGR